VKITVSAPAKTILLGEHFVVYNEPAIAIALNRRVKVEAELRQDNQVRIALEDLQISGRLENYELKIPHEELQYLEKIEPIWFVIKKILKTSKLPRSKYGVNIKIHSNIPIASGLGSSAATAAATTLAVSKLFNVKVSNKEIFYTAYEAEKLVHGTPSGIDPAVATYGGTLLFRKDKGFKMLDTKTEILLVIGNTGVKRSTGEYVARVRENLEHHPTIIKSIMKTGGKIVRQAVEALKLGDVETLGELMNINHGLLSAIGVSHPKLEELIYASRQAGALGAKLTGGGGGGCMIALCTRDKLSKVANAIEHAGGEAIIAEKTDEGVKIEA
jgi:mevalonate kinase